METGVYLPFMAGGVLPKLYSLMVSHAREGSDST